MAVGSIEDELAALQDEAGAAIAACDDLGALEDLRVQYLGRKQGRITAVMSRLKEVSPEERPVIGQAANRVKDAIGELLDAKKAGLNAASLEARAADEAVDLSLPGRQPSRGRIHPVNAVMEEIVDIFKELGFQVATGPDVETEYYNFDSLNTPPDHPARDSHDTFYVKPGVVLRTHTSPVQMRVMEKTQPPVAVIVPGRVYRVDLDATHSPMFNQLEGLLVDSDVTFAELKGTLMHFVHRFFGPDTKMRLRPHFFPFTEPSAEVDILWTAQDRHTGKTVSRWLEILGCGMVHPRVFEYAGYETGKYTGFAFGMGLDRIAMVRHGISSIAQLYENDIRFLEQF